MRFGRARVELYKFSGVCPLIQTQHSQDIHQPLPPTSLETTGAYDVSRRIYPQPLAKRARAPNVNVPTCAIRIHPPGL